VILFQVSVFAVEDVRRYQRVLHREQTSPSLDFTHRLENEVLSRWAPDESIRIFRDATMYVCPSPKYEVHLRWRSPEHQDLVEIQSDLILLRQSEIDLYRDESIVAESFDPEQAGRSHRFYRDVRDDAVRGIAESWKPTSASRSYASRHPDNRLQPSLRARIPLHADTSKSPNESLAADRSSARHAGGSAAVVTAIRSALEEIPERLPKLLFELRIGRRAEQIRL
jgi:hypothetical protein